MSPYYEFSYVLEEGLALIPALLSMIPSGVVGIAAYILTSMALYTMAKRRGINNPWLSWVPVLNCWIVGSLSDQYRYVVKGENKSKRKVLLTLKIINAIFAAVILVVAIVLVVNAIGGAMYGMDEEDLLEEVVGPALGVAGLALPMAGVAIAAAVVRYMALYDIYTSCDPGNNVLFTVLSILFGVTEPFFLFFNRNKDLGMPPRREEPAYAAPQEDQWQPQTEPWEENKDYL